MSPTLPYPVHRVRVDDDGNVICMESSLMLMNPKPDEDYAMTGRPNILDDPLSPHYVYPDPTKQDGDQFRGYWKLDYGIYDVGPSVQSAHAVQENNSLLVDEERDDSRSGEQTRSTVEPEVISSNPAAYVHTDHWMNGPYHQSSLQSAPYVSDNTLNHQAGTSGSGHFQRLDAPAHHPSPQAHNFSATPNTSSHYPKPQPFSSARPAYSASIPAKRHFRAFNPPPKDPGAFGPIRTGYPEVPPLPKYRPFVPTPKDGLPANVSTVNTMVNSGYNEFVSSLISSLVTHSSRGPGLTDNADTSNLAYNPAGSSLKDQLPSNVGDINNKTATMSIGYNAAGPSPSTRLPSNINGSGVTMNTSYSSAAPSPGSHFVPNAPVTNNNAAKSKQTNTYLTNNRHFYGPPPTSTPSQTPSRPLLKNPLSLPPGPKLNHPFPASLQPTVIAIKALAAENGGLHPLRIALKRPGEYLPQADAQAIRDHFHSSSGVIKKDSELRDWYGDAAVLSLECWEFLLVQTPRPSRWKVAHGHGDDGLV